MRSKLKGRRPSPAMVVAVVALVATLAGTAFAGVATISKLNGKTVKKNSLPGNRVKKKSLPGNRIKKNSITGKQVKESSLGKVPNATNAGNANTVGGNSVSKIAAPLAAGTNATLFSGKGLTLSASCSAGAALAITATTSKQAAIYSELIDTGADAIFAGDLSNLTFNPGVVYDLAQGGDFNNAFVTFEYDTTDNSSVSGTFSTDNFVAGGCRVFGMALSG